MAVTLKDVAREVGLSLQSVSDVLNCGDTRYSAATRQRVREAAARLGYQPNLMAQAMVSGRTHTLGMVTHGYSTPVAAEKIEALCFEARRRGYQAYLGTVTAPDDEREIISEFLGRRVDGLVCMVHPQFDPQPYRQLLAGGTPLVLIGNTTPATGDLPIVEVHPAEGVRLAARHLIELGHRRIALAVGKGLVAMDNGRFAGYCKALEETGLPFAPELIMSDRDISPAEARVFTAAAMRLPSPPTAFIYSNDMMALIGMHTLWELGFNVPGDVSVVGYDDLLFAEHLSPALTTVRQPRAELADAVLDLLLSQIRESGRPLAPTILLPSLVSRQSTAKCPPAIQRRRPSRPRLSHAKATPPTAARHS